VQLDREDLYLALQHVTLLVSDQDRSLRFFVDRLGFNLFADHLMPGGRGRWVAVAPPDGTQSLR
jgi:catechol 2,3-dioxygenase-like lactoylglutathione lyase family enzyme